MLVDSSVWIDFFQKKMTAQTAVLHRVAVERRQVVVGDLVLTEVLQGARQDRQFVLVASRLAEFRQLTIVNSQVAVQAAQHYRTLRRRGITIRKTIDTLIATRCIIDRLPLLYSDRDFDPFVEHFGLIPVLDPRGVN